MVLKIIRDIFLAKLPGEPPDTLLSYFPHKADGTADFLLSLMNHT
jgi:hypothetical protein